MSSCLLVGFERCMTRDLGNPVEGPLRHKVIILFWLRVSFFVEPVPESRSLLLRLDSELGPRQTEVSDL